MHRNRVLIKYKEPVYINAKIIGKSSNKKIYDVQLDPSPVWKKKLINTIHLNYKGSNGFEEVFPLIEKLINSKYDLLFQYNASIIKGISQFLEIETEIVMDNTGYLTLENKLMDLEQNDYTQFPELALTKPAKKMARVLKICENEGATVFINAIGGTELYIKDEFKKYDLDLFFIKTLDATYNQFSKDFYPHLSIIDVLMNNGKERTKELLNLYELV